MPPCVAKTCAVRPVFARVAGELRAADPRIRSKRLEANASLGAHSEAPVRSLGAGHQQHPKPDNQDNQHMLNQPRGSFPEGRTKFC